MEREDKGEMMEVQKEGKKGKRIKKGKHLKRKGKKRGSNVWKD